ncbi:DUF4153 domain-containing protein [uncultured Massilia sp.]|uniref:DUF4153 domain-containing protein n=1 Tax=uncultured Massilia sp. TaxID=169973 RepID=UPI0025D0F4B0|nr:DUF4153 domain-containing protein [uncultured Massilia sp.]
MPASDLPDSPATAQVGRSRLLLGLSQGLCLYLLYRAVKEQAWPADTPLLFAPLILVALYLPQVAISALGHMERRALLAWLGAAALVLAALGCYDAWRGADLPLTPLTPTRGAHAGPRRSPMPSALLLFQAAAGLFIAHSLVLAAARDRRRIAAYPTHFDLAWKLGVQLAFSAMFTGVTWLVLLLGAQLFDLVKLDFLSRLMREEWFAIPVSAFAFACAMHLTDVRPAIVRGIRGLLLVLLSWLLPVAVLLVGGFLLALPVTGLEPLWGTRRAASVLLCASAVFVVLINAAWQQGGDGHDVARVVRLATRIAAVLPAPLVLLAVHALFLRVREHGWTGDRVAAAACMLVAACYAAGYFRAALRPGWLPALGWVNVATAFVVVGLLLALNSPLLDPARVAVASQVARLHAGKTPVDRFDFAWLRFDGARFGRAALDRLEREAGSKPAGPDAARLRARIAAARKLASRWDARAPVPLPAPDLLANLRVRGAQALPAGLLDTDWASKPSAYLYPACLRAAGRQCDAVVLDLGNGGRPAVLLVDGDDARAVVLGADAQGRWDLLGTVAFDPAPCADLLAGLAAGQVRSVAPVLQDIEVGGIRGRVARPPLQQGCRRQ